MVTRSAFLLSQGFALVAFAFGLASYQLRTRRQVLLCLVGCTLFNAVHFALLARTTAAGLACATGVRYLAAIATTRRSWMGFFLVVTAGTAYFTFQGPVSVLPAVGTLVGTWGSFQADDRTVRRAMMVGTGCWAIHNVVVGTPVGSVMELSILVSNVVGYRRRYGAPK